MTPLSALWAFPLLAGLLLGGVGRRRGSGAAGAAGVAGALLWLACCWVFVSSTMDILPQKSAQVFRLQVDGLSATLLPLQGGLALVALVGFPRRDMAGPTASRVLLTEAGALGALLSTDLLSLSCFLVLSLLPLLADARDVGDPVLWRAARWFVALSALPLVLGLLGVAAWAGPVGLSWPYRFDEWQAKGLQAPVWVEGALLLGSLARMGVFPLHLWLPVVLERGRAPLVAVAVLSPLGPFALARLGLGLFPRALAWAGGWALALGAVSAVYGTLLALTQNQARRQQGYLGLSFAGLVLSGLVSAEAEGLCGALLHAMALALAQAGLLVCLRGVEARTGTLDMRLLGGLFPRLSGMAVGYLLLGLAAMGFPGTVAFISEDLLIQGLLHRNAPVAVALLGASALGGIVLVRSYKRIFLGPAAGRAPSCELYEHIDGLLPRERAVLACLVAALVAGGFFPAPLLAIREDVDHGPLRGAVREAPVQIERPVRPGPQ